MQLDVPRMVTFTNAVDTCPRWAALRPLRPVVVRLRANARENIAAIQRLPIDTGSGTRVPLPELADVAVRFGRMAVFRESNSPFVAVKANVRGRDLAGWVAEAQAKVAADVKLPEGTYLVWGGEFENQQRVMARLAVIVPVSLGVIFALLVMALGSVRSALLILTNAPLTRGTLIES